MKNANNRRDFLKKLAAGSLSALALPAWSKDSSPALPVFSSDESYWEMVKKQFAVPTDRIMVNAANLCPAPFQVNERVAEFARELNKDVSFQFRAMFDERRTMAIEQLAAYIHAGKGEVGITRNTSEGNCIVSNGLDLKSGDEIVLWEQNHPSNMAAWQKQSKRIGFTVKAIAVPPQPKTQDELVEPFRKAITAKTKLISFSHISNTSGLALPAKEICQYATSKGVLSLVDGAQSLGLKNIDVKEIGCSFYTSSTHKWLMGPLENGVLYVSPESMERLWPNIIGGGWHDGEHTVDEKICVLGQRNDPTTAALPDILAFHEAIGKKNIDERVMHLTSHLKERIQAKLPAATFVTPLSPAFSAGIVIIKVPGKEPNEIYQKLYEKHGIASAVSGGGLRFSPHIYNTPEQMNHIVDAVVSLA